MKREELTELHYITPIANVPSILQRGLLSHRRAAAVAHESVAMSQIQARRARIRVPSGRPLHEYVNLYFHARNPMMSKRRAQHATLCVLRVSTNVLDLLDVVIADRNASSDHVRWLAAPDGLDRLDHGTIFAEYWTHPGDQVAEWRHRSAKCAEVLVPDIVEPRFIAGAYVSGQAGRDMVVQLSPSLPITVDAHLFFQREAQAW